MPSIGVGQQHSVRQVLAQHVGIPNRNHVVEHPVHDETRLRYFAELSETLTIKMFPGAKGSDLSHCNVWTRQGLTILLTRCEPRRESLACRLTRLAWREEESNQLFQSWQLRIVRDLLQLRLLHMHDVLSALRSGGDKKHLADQRRTL